MRDVLEIAVRGVYEYLAIMMKFILFCPPVS